VDTVDLQPNEKLLEVGCGPGSNFEFLPAHGEIVGIDIAPGCIDLAGEKIKELGRTNITAQVMDICEATLPDDSFDKVFTLTAMIACRNPLKALQQMRRVLKPNGMLVTFEAPKSEIKEVAALQYLLHPVTTVGGMCWIPSYPFGLLPYNAHYDLTAMLPVAGFEIVENVATFDPYAILHLTKSKAVK
jgi:ubiquinone/menaquinone biosynthesis C-methylase UbiE